MSNPVVRCKNTAADRKRLKRILSYFLKNIEEKEFKKIFNGGAPIFCETEDDLLSLRRKLWNTAKSGMIGRNDLELEIGLYAALVWYNRLEISRRQAIEEEWAEE